MQSYCVNDVLIELKSAVAAAVIDGRGDLLHLVYIHEGESNLPRLHIIITGMRMVTTKASANIARKGPAGDGGGGKKKRDFFYRKSYTAPRWFVLPRDIPLLSVTVRVHAHVRA